MFIINIPVHDLNLNMEGQLNSDECDECDDWFFF